jgi:hypothetical protein
MLWIRPPRLPGPVHRGLDVVRVNRDAARNCGRCAGKGHGWCRDCAGDRGDERDS